MKKITRVRHEFHELKKAGKLDDAERQSAKEDLKYLCRDILGMRDWDQIHDDLQEFLDKIVWEPEKRKKIGRQYKLIMIPRGHLKSSVVTKGWSVQQLLRNSDIRILIANAKWDNARSFLKTIADWLQSFSRLPKLFGTFRPALRQTSGWNKDAIRINQRTYAADQATVTTTGIECAQASQHYDIIILDDLVVRENIGTKDQRDKVKTFYKDTISLLEPDGIILVIGTTWHEDDLYSELRDPTRGMGKKYAGNTFIRVAEKGTEESVIFKKKFNLQNLMEIKEDQGAFLYSAQYLLNPYPEEDQEFKKTWFKYYERIPTEEPLYITMTIDPSLGKVKSDHAAITVTGINSKGLVYVMEARRFKVHVDLFPSEVIRTVKYWTEKGFHIEVIGLEAFQFQQVLQDPIQQALLANGFPQYVDLLPRMNVSSWGKKERISALIPKYAAGLVRHPRYGCDDLEEELLKWKSDKREQQDDIIDALAWQAVKYWQYKPSGNHARHVPEGSFQWHLNNMKKNDNDLFKDFRRTEEPGVLV